MARSRARSTSSCRRAADHDHDVEAVERSSAARISSRALVAAERAGSATACEGRAPASTRASAPALGLAGQRRRRVARGSADQSPDRGADRRTRNERPRRLVRGARRQGGSLSLARAALGLGAMIALADRRSQRDERARRRIVPGRGAPVDLRLVRSRGQGRAARGEREQAHRGRWSPRARRGVSPQPIVTSGASRPSSPSDFTALPSSAAVWQRPGAAAEHQELASLREPCPRRGSSSSSCHRRRSDGAQPAGEARHLRGRLGAPSERTVVLYRAASARPSPTAESGIPPSASGATASAMRRISRGDALTLLRRARPLRRETR